MSALQDEGLAPQAGAFDFDAVYRAHAQAVARWALRLGGHLIDPEDVVQEVFVVVHAQLEHFRGEAKITTWLFRITENVVRHRRRRERLRRWLRGSSDDVMEGIASPRPTPVEDLERRQASQLVYRVLDTLSEKHRRLIILFEIDGCSGEEIAELTGMKVAAVWVALHRAREQFLRALTKLEKKRKVA